MKFIICQDSQTDSEDHYPIFERKLMNPAKTVYPKHAINSERTIEPNPNHMWTEKEP